MARTIRKNMTSPATCSRSRRSAKPPATTTAPSDNRSVNLADVLEEIRQLRAAISIYRHLVSELLEERSA
jgi:hypothetical protein